MPLPAHALHESILQHVHLLGSCQSTDYINIRKYKVCTAISHRGPGMPEKVTLKCRSLELCCLAQQIMEEVAHMKMIKSLRLAVSSANEDEVYSAGMFSA